MHSIDERLMYGPTPRGTKAVTAGSTQEEASFQHVDDTHTSDLGVPLHAPS